MSECRGTKMLFFRVFLYCSILFFLTACETPPATAKQAFVTVDMPKKAHSIPKNIFGSNIQWEWNGDRILVNKNGHYVWRDGVVDAINQAGVTSIRFPGGALADTYHWEHGIGDQAKRKPGISYAGTPAESNFGSDEFTKLTQLTNSEPVMIVNFNTSPQDAASWVEYVNGSLETKWGKRRKQNGIAQPLGAKYWEIGNEIYSPNEPGHTSATNYGKKLVEFAQAMKKVDSSIKIGAALEISFLQAAWMAPIYPHMATWNEEVLKVAGKHIDFVSLHFYTPYDKDSNEKLRKLVFSGPIVFEQNLEKIRNLLKKYSHNKVELTVTEYNTFFGDTVKLDRRTAGTEAALFNSMMLFSFMRNPDITVANHHSLLNNDVFGMMETYETGLLRKRPSYEIFKRLSTFAGASLLNVRVESDGYSQNAKGNVPEIAEVPYIDAIAVSTKDKLRVAFVNRAFRETVSTTLSFGPDYKNKVFKALIFDPDNLNMSYTWRESKHELQVTRDETVKLMLPPQSFAIVYTE